MVLHCVMKDSGQAFGKTSSGEEYQSQLMEGLWNCCHSSSGTTG